MMDELVHDKGLKLHRIVGISFKVIKKFKTVFSHLIKCVALWCIFEETFDMNLN